MAVLLTGYGHATLPGSPPAIQLFRVNHNAGFDKANNFVLVWDAAALQAFRDTHPGPTITSRALAVLHTCIFDAWAAYDPVAVGTRLGGRLRRPAIERTIENKSKAISFAAYRALVDLFPTQKSAFDATMSSLGYNPTDTSTDVRTPAGIGNVASQAVLEYRHHDGSNQLGDLHPGAYSDYTGYAPVNTPEEIADPNRWQPLRVSDGHGGFVVQHFTTPQWYLVKPFALVSGSQFRPAGPARFPSDSYENQARQILAYNANLTDQQKVIAEYWADGPGTPFPPGHWCVIGAFVSGRDHHTIDDDVKMFFMIANAVFDGGIAAWDAKRVYDSVRPITAIHYLFAGKKVRAWAGPYKGTRLIEGGDWQPYQAVNVVTPPFPEFFSGHSMFSAAAAEILRRYSGSDAYGASFTEARGASFIEPGAVPAERLTLSWATFTEAADQAGLSRRYGGIHFQDGDLVARRMGRLIGDVVWEKAQTYINGEHFGSFGSEAWRPNKRDGSNQRS